MRVLYYIWCFMSKSNLDGVDGKEGEWTVQKLFVALICEILDYRKTSNHRMKNPQITD